MSEVLIPPFGGATVLNQQQTITGNTAGASTWSGTNQILEAGSNITISVSGNSLVFHGGGGGAPPFSTYRSNAWSVLGVYVASVSPATPVVYSDWSAGSTGYFGWLSLPP